MICESYLNGLSREQLYSVISHLDSVTYELKTEIKFLKTDLLKSKLLSDCYQKYFNIFSGIIETIDLNEEVLNLLAKIKSLNNEKQCFVSLNRLESQKSLNQILSNEPKTLDLRRDAINPSESDTENNSQQTDNCDDTNSSRNVEVSDYQSTNQPKGDQSIVETSEETNNHNSKTIILPQKSRGRPKGWKMLKFDCLWSGCQQRFTNKRSLSIHTLSKHKLRRKQQMVVRADPMEVSNEPKPSNSRSDDNSGDNDLLDFEDSCNESMDQPLGGPSIVEIFEELNNQKSKNIIRPKKLRGRPKGWKIKPKPRFHCLWSGCEQWFTDIRGLKLHTLRKHKLRPKQKMTIRADPIENSENINTETFENTQQTDPFVNKEMSAERATDCESTNQSIEKQPIVETPSDEQISGNPNDESNDYNTQQNNETQEYNEINVRIETIVDSSESQTKSEPRFECLWSGCEQWFTNKRGLNLHTLRKHNLRIKQKIILNKEETNKYKSMTIIPKRSVGRPKGSKNKSKKRFKCLSNGCQKQFFGIKGLSLHLREHQLRNDPKIILKGRTKVNASTNTITRVVPFGGSTAHIENQSTNLNEEKNQKSNENYIKSKESDTDINNSDNYTAEEVNNSTDQTLKEQTIVETFAKTNEYKLKKIIPFKKLGRPKNKSKPRFDCLKSGCQQSFTGKRGLNLHTLRKHLLKPNQKSGSNIKTFICDFEGCGFRTITKDRLINHKLKHSNEHPFGCVLFGKLSKDVYMARDHLLAVHPEECPEFPYIECPENGCDYKTKLPSYMSKHQTLHTLPVVCGYCQKRFKDKDQVVWDKHRLSCGLPLVMAKRSVFP